MKAGCSGFRQGRSPQYHHWTWFSQGGNYNCTLLKKHVNRGNHRLAIPYRGIYLRMKLGYFWWISHSSISSLCVLAVRVVSRANVSLLVGFRIFKKGRMVSLLIICEPCHKGFNWMYLKFTYWRRGYSVSANCGSWEGLGRFQIETSLGWPKTCVLAHFLPGPSQGFSDLLLVGSSLRPGEWQTSFPKSPKNRSRYPRPQQIHKTWSSR